MIEAENGEDAIARTSSQLPDIVLMDLGLPIVDGWEATRRLKTDARTSHIPDALITELRRVLSR